MIDLKIVVPSHRRAQDMPRLLSLLPSAIVTVNESEVDEYLEFVPESQLLAHPDVGTGVMFGIGAIRHWIMDNVDAEFICQCDDDLRAMRSFVFYPPRVIRDGEMIESVIRNGAMVLKDLDLPLYGWAANSSPMSYSNCQPIRMHEWVGQLIVMNTRHYGDGKSMFYDSSLNECEDGDLVLQVLLNARALFKEVRFSFDFGIDNGNAGGLQGKRTEAEIHKVWLQMKKKWKGHWGMSFDSDGKPEESSKKVIRVRRTRKIHMK